MWFVWIVEMRGERFGERFRERGESARGNKGNGGIAKGVRSSRRLLPRLLDASPFRHCTILP